MRPPTPGQSTAFTEDYPAGTRTLTTAVRLGAHLAAGQGLAALPQRRSHCDMGHRRHL